MSTQQQAYIEGFVKRASEYGFSQAEAVTVLKRAGFFEDMADNMESDIFNQTANELSAKGLPHHMAVYGMNNLTQDDAATHMVNMIKDKYNSDVFGAAHPMLANIANSLKSHNIDPSKAALAAGGAGLLGGGYMLGKHMNKDKKNGIETIKQ